MPQRPPLADLDTLAFLHALGDDLHEAADQLPLPERVHAGADISEDVEDQAHRVTRLLLRLAHQVAVDTRLAARYPGQYTDTQRLRTAVATRAAAPLGQALAELGEIVTQLGFLHQITAWPRGGDRVDAQRSARAVIEDRLDAADSALRSAARQLRADADHRPSLTRPGNLRTAALSLTAPGPASVNAARRR